MTTPEIAAVWVAIIAYTAGTITVFTGIAFKKEKWVAWAQYMGIFGLVAHAAAIALRWQSSGHFPYIEDYENVLVGTFAMVLAWLFTVRFRRGFVLAGALVLPVVLLTLGWGMTQAGDPTPVTPPYQSSWLVVHVTFAWITYAAYSAVAGLAIVYLLRERAARLGTETRGIPAWVPPSDEIDDISLKLVAFGFLNNSIMIASGAIWAYRLWGSYWSWDPVETWSLFTWLAYGFYLHAKLTLGWSGKRLAWVALIALFGVMMAFWGVQLAPTSFHLFRDIGGTMMEMRN